MTGLSPPKGHAVPIVVPQPPSPDTVGDRPFFNLPGRRASDSGVRKKVSTIRCALPARSAHHDRFQTQDVSCRNGSGVAVACRPGKGQWGSYQRPKFGAGPGRLIGGDLAVALLLDPATVIEPYEQPLNKMSAAERRTWAKTVLTALKGQADLEAAEAFFWVRLQKETRN